MRLAIIGSAFCLACACSPPSPQPQPNEMETVNATYVDEAAPAGALGDETANYGEGSVTPAEQNDMGNAIRSQDHPSSGNSQ